MSKRILGIILAGVLLFFSVSVYAQEESDAQDYGPEIFAESYCVLDGETGEVLMSKNKDEKLYPASTTKIMTAILVLENISDLSMPVTFTSTAVAVDPSSSTLEPKASAGETMTVKDVLMGMLLKSGNECAALLGELVGGDEAHFAGMMNEKAKELGAYNTHFVNAHGFHNDDHYTTAYDLALILRAAMQDERYREINATVRYTIPTTNMAPERTFMIGHGMINGAVPAEGVIGGKTGSTPQAGKTLATACIRDGFYTISTLMKSDTENVYADETVLLEYAYGFHDHSIRPYEPVRFQDEVTPLENVRLRYSPSLNGGVAGMFETGYFMERTGMYGDWSLLKDDDGRTVYAATAYLKSTLNPELIPVTEPYVYVEPETEAPSEEDTSESAEAETEPSGSMPSASSSGTEETEDSDTKEKKPLLNFDEMDAGDLFFFLIPGVIILILLILWIVIVIDRVKDKKDEHQIRGRRR